MSNLHVGKFSYETTEASLRSFFANVARDKGSDGGGGRRGGRGDGGRGGNW